jgi:hypothetical protein
MALRLLKDPEAFPSFPVAQAALMLASAAWNCAVEETEWSGPTPSVELRSNDTGRLIAELVEHKRDRYPNDLRRIVATELSPDGSVRVHWVEQDEAVTPASGSTTGRTRNAGVKTGRPIAEKLIGKMKKKVRGKLIHLEEVKAGRANAEDLQKSVATSEAACRSSSSARYLRLHPEPVLGDVGTAHGARRDGAFREDHRRSRTNTCRADHP